MPRNPLPLVRGLTASGARPRPRAITSPFCSTVTGLNSTCPTILPPTAHSERDHGISVRPQQIDQIGLELRRKRSNVYGSNARDVIHPFALDDPFNIHWNYGDTEDTERTAEYLSPQATDDQINSMTAATAFIAYITHIAAHC